MKVNVATKRAPVHTHEGALAAHLNPEQALRRSVMACLLWEDSFYENGESIAERIAAGVAAASPAQVAAIAVEARTRMKLRHVPLLLVRAMARSPKHKALVAETLTEVVQRADELTEFLAIYWKDGRQKLSAQVKKGLARAFVKFDAYQLAKYNRDGAVKLRDVLFLCHAKPKDDAQAATWKLLVEQKLPPPDTWEVALSAGAGKKETFERLMAERKLFALAFLRNLRNMHDAGVEKSTVAGYARSLDLARVLPFRFIAAAAAVPRWEDLVEPMLLRAAGELTKLKGPTAVLIDHSGSMEQAVSAKSQVSRFDAAAALAIIVRECCDDVAVFTFSDTCVEVPARRGFALRDAIKSFVHPVGTQLGMAVRHVYQKFPRCGRLIVVTDEQSADRPPAPQGRGYVINVGSDQHGVGYGEWTHIDGWSEAVLDYVRAIEAAS